MPSVILPSATQHRGCPCHSAPTDADMQLLEALTAPRPTKFRRRDAHLDPLLLAAATLSGPDVTRHHYHHGFSAADIETLLAQQNSQTPSPASPTSGPPANPAVPRYTSKQAPRRERLAVRDENKENVPSDRVKPRRNSLVPLPSAVVAAPAPVPVLVVPEPVPSTTVPVNASPYLLTPARPLAKPSEPVDVQCLVRTRIPTAHGEVFLHLYRNNRDGKEHMAVVVDSAQLRPLDSALPAPPVSAPPIRSQSLDAVWSNSETDMDRVVRGAYVGRLSESAATSSVSSGALQALPRQRQLVDLPAPLVRIHSECFTGETVGSMRCDCGEQLDEAVRRISQPVMVATPDGPAAVPGRGVVVYMRQEGRGIGLLSKLRAYNLQDLGHDTVAANLMLGHGADERRYEIAAAILRDLGFGLSSSEGVRLLTNNPDKISALKTEGVRVVAREEMVPRAWRCDQGDTGSDSDATLALPDGERLGAHTPRGEDLDRYLKTKITRMGHLLDAPTPASTPTC